MLEYLVAPLLSVSQKETESITEGAQSPGRGNRIVFPYPKGAKVRAGSCSASKMAGTKRDLDMQSRASRGVAMRQTRPLLLAAPAEPSSLLKKALTF